MVLFISMNQIIAVYLSHYYHSYQQLFLTVGPWHLIIIGMKDFKVSFYENKTVINRFQEEHVIIYMIRGRSAVDVNGELSALNSQDFIIINSGSEYTINSDNGSFMLLIEINSVMLQEMYSSGLFHFQCCSSRYMGVKYEKFRYLIQNLLGEYAIEKDGISCRKLSILYSLCDGMMQYFLVSDIESDKSTDGHTSMIPVMQYVSSHYREKISLDQMAALMYMAPSSFSRKFKKIFGTNFVTYVAKVRMNHALDDLLNSALPVSDIAMNNGFGTASQFNKAFKTTYNMSPREYKASYLKDTYGSVADPTLSDAQANELKNYISKKRLTVVKEQELHIQEITTDCLNGCYYENPFGDIVTLGFASSLLSGEYQHQISELKQNLDFQYGTINGLFSPEMNLLDAAADKLNFVNLDQVLDFLVANRIKPLIVYDNKIFNLIEGLGDVHEMKTVNCFKSTAHFSRITGAIIDHCMNRYGIKEVSNWKFSIWYYTVPGTVFGFKNRFCEIWDTFYGVIRSRLSDTEIGGCAYTPNTDVYVRGIKDFYREWNTCKYLPDFLTMFCFPYVNVGEESNSVIKRTNLDTFMDEAISSMKQLLLEISFPKKPIYIIEWNLSMFQRNAFNDMAAKAPIMISQMSRALGEVSKVCYWYANDISSYNTDNGSILTGACGLMSADGIYKPSFYALQFFRELYNIVIERGDHYIVTKDDLGHFAIILYNNKQLNYNYYSMNEESVGSDDEETIFSERNSLEITLTLQNIPDKTYRLRRQTIGPSKGSVLDEWRRFGTDTELSLSDLDYLKRRCVPYRSNDVVTPENGNLTLIEILDTHEVTLITLT